MPAASNPFARKETKRHAIERSVFLVFRFTTYFVIVCALVVFLDIGIKGGVTVFRSTPPFVNIPFFTEKPETLYVFQWEGKNMQLGDRAFRKFKADHQIEDIVAENYVYCAGGIFPAIVGTVLLVAGSMILALVLGVASAIYLSEYSQQNAFIGWVRLAILNLAGVPSIVFGLFGFGMFVIYFKWNVSLLAGWCTLALMVLPVIITASEEALRAVPQGFRDGALALGASKWQAIRTNVLPYALPGILTSSILGVARVAGETAPIMFTAAYVVRDELPWEGLTKISDFFFQGVVALPYHIYVVSSKIPQNEYTARVQYGTAFVFLFVVMAISLASILMRIKLRTRYRW